MQFPQFLSANLRKFLLLVISAVALIVLAGPLFVFAVDRSAAQSQPQELSEDEGISVACEHGFFQMSGRSRTAMTLHCIEKHPHGTLDSPVDIELEPTESVTINCQAEQLRPVGKSSSLVTFECVNRGGRGGSTPRPTNTPIPSGSTSPAPSSSPGPSSSPTSTPEPTISPSPSHHPSPTSQPMPSASPTPTGDPVPGEQPVAGAPECQDHNPRLYHGLWNAAQGCHYDHTHADNPHELDGLFGTEYYTVAGGEISYPWETHDENHHKHETYKWLVRDHRFDADSGCISQFADGCVLAFRAQHHADFFNVASTFHSYAIEGLVCVEDEYNAAWQQALASERSGNSSAARPSDSAIDQLVAQHCGIIRHGGWQHTGDLMINEQQVIDVVEPRGAPRPVKLHYTNQFATWYPVNPSGIVRISQEVGDMWGYYPIPQVIPVPVLNHTEHLQFYCPVDLATGEYTGECSQDDKIKNGSRIQAHVIGFSLPPRHRNVVDPDRDGILNAQTWVNAQGEWQSGCTTVSADCIPASFENAKLPPSGQWQYRGDYREYDVSPPGESWIRFPN